MTTERMPTEERLKELLLGKKVVEVRVSEEAYPEDEWGHGPVGYLTLSDGTQLKVGGNDGGCACTAGCYPLETLNRVDNIITNVEVDEDPRSDDEPCRTCGEVWSCYEEGHDNSTEGHYRIFVYAEDEQITLASFEGSDGNGYYGTGWWLEVLGD